MAHDVSAGLIRQLVEYKVSISSEKHAQAVCYYLWSWSFIHTSMFALYPASRLLRQSSDQSGGDHEDAEWKARRQLRHHDLPRRIFPQFGRGDSVSQWSARLVCARHDHLRCVFEAAAAAASTPSVSPASPSSSSSRRRGLLASSSAAVFPLLLPAALTSHNSNTRMKSPCWIYESYEYNWALRSFRCACAYVIHAF